MFFTRISFAQKESIDSLFKVFENDITIEQSLHDGNVIWDVDTRESYYYLLKVAPIDSLINFIDNSNAAIRCSIFDGLLSKKANKKTLEKIYYKYRNDSAIYYNAATDFRIYFRVNDYMKLSIDNYDNKKKVDYKKMLTEILKQKNNILPGVRHDNIRKEEIVKVDSLNFDSKVFKVLSFNAIFVRNKESEVFKVESKFFTNEMKEKILLLKSGDRIYFDDIKVLTKDGTKRTCLFNVRIE